MSADSFGLSQPAVMGLLLLVALLMGTLVGARAVRWRRTQLWRWRLRRAAAAEHRARKVLERAGYRVLGEQIAREWPLVVDGQHSSCSVRADYMVARGGNTYIAEVKSGALVSRLSHGPTRRQLLEYCLAYDCAGVLLVDMEAETIHEVAFPGVARRDPSVAQGFAAGVLFGGLLVVIAWMTLRSS